MITFLASPWISLALSVVLTVQASILFMREQAAGWRYWWAPVAFFLAGALLVIFLRHITGMDKP